MARILDDWLTTYADYTAETETPSLFHFWSGVSVISSTLERKTHMERGYYTLYPNLYIVIIGASARVRKTTAIRTAYDVFRSALPKHPIVSQKVTPEALISMFVEGFKDTKVSGGTIVAYEMGVFLGNQQKSADIMQLLTDWYDCPSHFEYKTMIRGKEIMDNVYCNMIAGTTPDWLRDSLPPHSIGGGFTSRIIFVYQDKPEKLIPFPSMSSEMIILKDKLVNDLRSIAKLKGKFTLTPAAIEWFTHWYTQIFKPEQQSNPAMDGYYGRKHDSLLKVAMVLSASKSDNMIVDEIELKMALKALNTNEKYLPQTLNLIQMTDAGEIVSKVHRIICKKGEIDFVALSRQVSYCMNTKMLEDVLTDLQSSEKIIQYIENGKRMYKSDVAKG